MRLKLIIGNALSAIVVGVVAWFLVRGNAADALGKSVDEVVKHALDGFRGARALEHEGMKAVAARVLLSDALRKVFEATTEKDQRDRADDFASGFAKDPAAQNGAVNPDYVVVTDAQGIVLGRSGDAALDRNRNLAKEFGIVAAVLAAPDQPLIDFIKYDNQKWFSVIVLPVRRGPAVAGTVLVAYQLADNAAKSDADRIGAFVGYLVREGNSFALPSASLDDNNKKQDLLRWVNDPANGVAKAFDDGASLPVKDVNIGGQTYRLSGSALPIDYVATAGSRNGFVVLQNLSAAKDPAGGIALPVLILIVVGALAGLGVNLMVSGDVLKTVGSIEDGLLRVINGDRSHRMEIRHAELGGIVDRVNQLVSVLSGEDEGEQTDEQGRISKPAPRGNSPQAVAPRKPE